MEDQDVVNLYKTGKSQYAIAKQFGVTHGKIQSVLRKHDIPIRQGNQNKKYTCNDNYFSIIDSHEKAYWLGFITADGSISKRNNEISLGLSHQDIAHLEQFRYSIKCDGKIFVYNSIVNGRMHKCCKFGVYSAQMKIDLSLHNIVPNKSKTLSINEKIPSIFTNSYLLGIIDGDGSFYVDKGGQMHFNLIGSKSEIESIQILLVQNCNLNQTAIQQESRSKEMYYLNYGGNRVLGRIVNFLYKDSPIYLSRKFAIIKHLLTASQEHTHDQL